MTEFVCEVDDIYRSACKDLPKYSGTRYCVLHYPGEEKNKEDFLKVKESKLAQKDYNFGGAVFPESTSDFKGFIFVAPVSFSEATFLGTSPFTRAKFNGETSFRGAKFNGDTDFSEVKFNSGADFSEARFSGEQTDFSEATFSEQTSFSDAAFGDVTNYNRTTFSSEYVFFYRTRFGSRVNFEDVTFSGNTEFIAAKFGEYARFRKVIFDGKTNFSNVTFDGHATFSATEFNGGTDFWLATFGTGSTRFLLVEFIGDTSFRGATFSSDAIFLGSKENTVFSPQAWVSFDDCRIEKPELFTFRSVYLRPSWFINVDARKANFTDVSWYGMPGGPKGTLGEEIGALQIRGLDSPHTILAQACRRLSANAEENREYPLANEFHYWAMDAVRKGSWMYFKGLTLKGLTKKETWRNIAAHFGLITTLYWALSGYGVRATRAFLVLVGICAAFAVLYMLFGPNALRVSSASNIWQAMEHIGQAVVYSMSTMARLNPEPKPSPGLFQFLVTIEGILGPLQIALLALAIRRKVMR